MNPETQLNRYLRKSVKNRIVDDSKINTCLDAFSDMELSMYWFHFKASRDFSRTERSGILDYKSVDKLNFFKLKQLSDNIQPKKDNQGKYVYERIKLQEHVKKIIYNDTVNEINEKLNFKHLPFIAKLPRYIIIVAVCTLPVLILSIIGNLNYLGQMCLLIYSIEFITYAIVFYILKGSNRNINLSNKK